jgi:hypothetical protein
LSVKDLINEIEFAQSMVEHIEKSGFANSKINAVVTGHISSLKEELGRWRDDMEKAKRG